MSPSETQAYVHGGVSGTERVLAPLAHCLAAAPFATALDTVEEAVRRLEDDPELNAGWGSVLNRGGRIELDAGIADGTTGAFGGVIGVGVRHPISLARRVMTATPHVLMAGEGAMALAGDMELLDSTTEEQIRRYQRALEEGKLEKGQYGADEHVDTVGAVALDSAGNLAAASSTGGVFGKLAGRVGDSAIFGAGTYASAGAAVIGTGVGELFVETLACARAGRLIEDGEHPQRACEDTIAYLGTRSHATAGLLALGADGSVGAAFRGGALRVEGKNGPLAPVRLA